MLYAAALLATIALIVWMRLRSPRPEFPPLPVGNDHPLMREAVAQARQRIGEFRQRMTAAPENAIVKFPLVTSSGSTEHVWAEVIEVVEGSLKVRLVTPPVSHQGTLERVHVKSFDDIEDWQITNPDGSLVGAFTQRAMFKIARQEWGSLPPKLAKIERRYLDS